MNQNIKAKIKEVKTYEVTINDKTFYGFRAKGHMAGMVHLVNKDGSIVIQPKEESVFSSLLEDITLSKSDDIEFSECEIVKASPNFIE